MQAALKRISCVVACIFSFALSAQIDTAFVHHLEKNNLKDDFLHYITTQRSTNDSVAILRMRYAIRYQNDSVVLAQYLKSPALFENDTVLLKKISLRVLTHPNYSVTQLWFSELLKPSPNDELLNAFTLAENGKASSGAPLPESFSYSFERMQKANKKKPVVAATLSVLLPGAGKLYAGKTSSALITFFSCSAYALQWAESSRKLSYTHPLSLVNAAFFTAFYSANIYGSIKAVQQTKRERKQQFLYEVAQYYR